MAGSYGTGKTLLAFKLAAEAIENDWTFIYLTDPTKTAEVMNICNELDGNGNGVLLFVEDIDLVVRGNRDANMNKIFNILDGGDTKGNNIISIFTTNHLELIEPTFLRGKRIGSLIILEHLDEATAKEFVEGYMGKNALSDDCTDAYKMAEQFKIVPSFMAEILDRVK